MSQKLVIKLIVGLTRMFNFFQINSIDAQNLWRGKHFSWFVSRGSWFSLSLSDDVWIFYGNMDRQWYNKSSLLLPNLICCVTSYRKYECDNNKIRGAFASVRDLAKNFWKDGHEMATNIVRESCHVQGERERERERLLFLQQDKKEKLQSRSSFFSQSDFRVLFPYPSI